MKTQVTKYTVQYPDGRFIGDPKSVKSLADAAFFERHVFDQPGWPGSEMRLLPKGKLVKVIVTYEIE